jgi:hypothetical protein
MEISVQIHGKQLMTAPSKEENSWKSQQRVVKDKLFCSICSICFEFLYNDYAFILQLEIPKSEC